MKAQKLTYTDVLPLLKLFVLDRENIVGGNLHIFLSDGNIEDSNILFCLKKCIDDMDLLGEAICRLSLKMSHTQRLKMYKEFGVAFKH